MISKMMFTPLKIKTQTVDSWSSICSNLTTRGHQCMKPDTRVLPEEPSKARVQTLSLQLDL